MCFCNPKRISKDLYEASSRLSYVETISNGADTLHLGLEGWSVNDLQKVYSRICENQLRKLHLGVCDVYIDITDEDFYGKTQDLWIVPWTHKDGISGHFKFLVCSINYRNRKFPIAVRMIRLGTIISREIGFAIDSCRNAGLRIREVLMDRGFYSADNINELNLKDVNYIIFAKKCQSFNSMLASTEKSAIIEYELKSRKNKSILRVQTNIALVKDVMNYDWIFATNLDISGSEIVHKYRLRWNIETDFRVMDEARIKTKSTRPEVRLFYFLIACIIFFVWSATQKFKLSFKKFVILLSKTEVDKRKIFFE